MRSWDGSMKRFLLLPIVLLVLLAIASAAKIDVSIDDDLKCEISSLTYNTSNNVTQFLLEVYNTGSIGYKARPRVDIFDGNESIFTGYGREQVLMPGERKNDEIYWYNKPGNHTLRVRVYFGSEILEHEEAISVSKPSTPESVFSIEEFRAYDSFAILDIVSNVSVKNVVVIPEDYLSSWIFEQATVGSICKNCRQSVLINYTSPAWMPNRVKIAVVSDNGIYYSEKIFEMEKNRGILWILYYFIDNLKILAM